MERVTSRLSLVRILYTVSSSSGLKIAPSSNKRAVETIEVTFSQQFARDISEMELAQDFDSSLQSTDLLEGDEPL